MATRGIKARGPGRAGGAPAESPPALGSLNRRRAGKHAPCVNMNRRAGTGTARDVLRAIALFALQRAACRYWAGHGRTASDFARTTEELRDMRADARVPRDGWRLADTSGRSEVPNVL